MAPSPKSDAGDLLKVLPSNPLIALIAREDDSLPDHSYIAAGKAREEERTQNITWMTTVAKKFGYVPETLYMALNFYDRFLSKTKMPLKRQRRLLALTCVNIAGKMAEELCEPLLKELVQYCDEEFTKPQILVCLDVWDLINEEFDLSCLHLRHVQKLTWF